MIVCGIRRLHQQARCGNSTQFLGYTKHQARGVGFALNLFVLKGLDVWAVPATAQTPEAAAAFEMG